MIRATPTPLILDHAAVRLNPDRAKDEHLVINLVLSDVKEEHRITVENSVLIHKAGARDDKAHATVTMKRTDLLETLLAGVPAGIKRAAGAIRVEGKPDAYNVLAGLSEPSASKSATAAPGAERLDVGAAARRDGSTAEEAAPRARPAGWHHRRLVRASAMMS